VAQVFNFVDVIGGLDALTPESAESFLISRGIIKVDKIDRTLRETYKLTNESSFFNSERLDGDLVKDMNETIREMDTLEEVELDAATINYKSCILQAYRAIQDPFNTEIVSEAFDYEQNPSDPSKP